MFFARTVFTVIAVTFCSQFALLGCAFAQGSGDTEDAAAVSSATSGSEALTARDIAYLGSPLISLIGVGLIVYFTRKSDVSEQWLKINEAEANYLQNKLDKFYGPFIVESDANHLLAQDLRSRQSAPEEYRLLDKLFDSEWTKALSAGDKELVREICQTGERLSSMIKENIGLVDPDILPYISRAIAHFRVLRLAYEGKLGDDSAPFLRYVYPKQLDPVLQMELERLQRRVKKLRQEPTTPHGEIAPLDLSNYPLEPWEDPDRPDFDPSSGELVVADGSGSSLLGSRKD
ncbi:hypothetical protein [Maritimibacter sp. 55A14]|uniref:hypothetical protein n=1 Tax=Maritimibacter sp. 55A14 TaxID=2174844 RepID=UPI0011B275E2|nr:hypothetical protein [Maritimibacter sp. 55A14]